ncbi:EF-hand domain-containing protein [Roseococcus pinisoli]|uniref:EF-hand domain-containing protein n=1 Tax=Roseococcus pinisoli TaxID=2835040 RepID=A0ABS5QGM3_9PROT|nr:EF-hand domain-containing protein [Roseococcus pinisoli]MBS7812834.1 hypothetical protein [Roseococcus pinisoli]
MTKRLMLAAAIAVSGAMGLGFPGAADAQAPAATPAPAARPADAERPQLTPEQQAAARQRFRETFLAQYDTNRDGTVTRAEYDAVRDAVFRRTDTNGDGSLSEAEYVGEYEGRLRAEYGTREIDETFRRQITQASRRFESIDRDRDLSISRAEYDAVASRTFNRADANRDGVVTEADWAIQPPNTHP